VPNRFFVRIPFEGVYEVKQIDFNSQEVILKRPGIPERTMTLQAVKEMGIMADFNVYQIGEAE
jgi:hypothetical protein